MPLNFICISPNKLNSDTQILEFPENRVVTLIGANGCGKSAILESILKDSITRNQPVICWSSGQNESFSKIFIPYLKKTNSKILRNLKCKKEFLMTSFFFDNTWTRLVVFFAVLLRRNGETLKYLQEHVYSASPKQLALGINLQITKSYWKLIKDAIEKETLEPLHKSIRKTFYHITLEKLINTIEEGYDFDRNFKKINLLLTAGSDAENIFGNDLRKIFTFLSIARHFRIINEKTSLRFLAKDDIELNSLSDGEYQLLATYALLDLFDAPNTLFLFDEIDAHLHFESIKKIWEIIKTVKGRVITTTHSMDSITQNELHSINLVEKGKLSKELVLNEIVSNQSKRLSSVNTHAYITAANVENIVLIDGRKDWFIFVELARIKIPDFDESILKSVHIIEKPSGASENPKNEFGKSKKDWIKEFDKHNENIKTKNIFIICDKDTLSIKQIKGVKVTGVDNIKFNNGQNHAYLLSWKRREIENYLISYSLFKKYDLIKAIKPYLPSIPPFKRGIPLDNNEIIGNIDFKNEIQRLYCTDSGVDYTKLEQVIKEIPVEEISEDIQLMYEFIKEKVTKNLCNRK